MICNTHELRTGDVLVFSGCHFALTERKVWRRPDDLQWDDHGTVTFQTDLLYYREGSMPRHWADTWTIQGNSRATWHVVVRDGEAA